MKKRNFIHYFILFLLLSTNNFCQKKQYTPEEILWTKKKIFASEKNFIRYIDSCLCFIARHTPPDFKVPIDDTVNAKDLMLNFVKLKKTHSFIAEIEEGYKKVTGTRGLKLKMIPSIHHRKDFKYRVEYSEEDFIWHQNFIKKTIKSSGYKLLFLEGFDIDPDWKNYYEDVKNGRNPPYTEKEVRKMLKKNNNWWAEFITNKKYQLMGYDERDIIYIGFTVEGMLNTPYVDKSNEIFLNFFMEIFNHYFRESLILSKIGRKMIAQNEKQAILVIGMAHLATLPSIARKWGIEMELVGPPKNGLKR